MCINSNREVFPLFVFCLIQNNVRDKTNVTYNSAIGVIFGVKKYANQLLKVSLLHYYSKHDFCKICHRW